MGTLLKDVILPLLALIVW